LKLGQNRFVVFPDPAERAVEIYAHFVHHDGDDVMTAISWSLLIVIWVQTLVRYNSNVNWVIFTQCDKKVRTFVRTGICGQATESLETGKVHDLIGDVQTEFHKKKDAYAPAVSCLSSRKSVMPRMCPFVRSETSSITA
jgi:hypothetical protein